MRKRYEFPELCYSQHAKFFERFASDSEESELAETWLIDDTVDAWRHRRMYCTIDPILLTEPGSYWLTVGDGRYGKDAKYILNNGSDALASDISEILLHEATEMGFISKYQVENAESLSFSDGEFDYVLCKEAYHHFPRPMIALYEMLRVARKGVVLIEPNDACMRKQVLENMFEKTKTLVKFLTRRRIEKDFYEETGNYVFSVSRRELEKVALGLNFDVISFKGINDAYFEGVEFEKLNVKGPLQKKTRAIINMKNLLCGLGLMDFGTLTAMLFKDTPSNELVRQLNEGGYEIVNLPRNPYIASDENLMGYP